MKNGVKTFNFLRNNSTEAFVNVVPSATDDNIQTISGILFNDAYQPMLNEFVTNLINRIGLTIIRNKTFSNPLSILRKGSMPLGTDIQDLYENPAEAEQYETELRGFKGAEVFRHEDIGEVHAFIRVK